MVRRVARRLPGAPSRPADRYGGWEPPQESALGMFNWFWLVLSRIRMVLVGYFFVPLRASPSPMPAALNPHDFCSQEVSGEEFLPEYLAQP